MKGLNAEANRLACNSGSVHIHNW